MPQPGFLYGALLDLSTMVTYGGEQSLDRYLELSARGLPFNLAHATGNFAIALAAGPALVRMISRFRTRLEFSWPAAEAVSLVVVVALGAATAGLVRADRAAAGTSAISWLRDAQSSDGGYAATPGQPSSPAMTGWTMLGLEAAGTNPLDVRSGGETPVTYLRDSIDRLRAVGDLERTILALEGAGLDPRAFAGEDLVANLRAKRDRDGSVDGQVNLTAFYTLAMRAAGADPSSLKRSAKWLRGAQNSDGGWGIQPRAPSESDSTGAALQGLIATGAAGNAAADGVHWLRRAQRPGGGWALGTSGIVNSQSTAWAVQGLVAAGSGAAEIDAAQRYLARLAQPRRPLLLLGIQRPDADLGHHAGGARHRAQGVPAGRGAASPALVTTEVRRAGGRASRQPPGPAALGFRLRPDARRRRFAVRMTRDRGNDPGSGGASPAETSRDPRRATPPSQTRPPAATPAAAGPGDRRSAQRSDPARPGAGG